MNGSGLNGSGLNSTRLNGSRFNGSSPVGSSTRREFLGQAAAGIAATVVTIGGTSKVLAQRQPGTPGSSKPELDEPAQAEPDPLNLLMLGGTGFLGPHIITCARQRGHTVTLFNRGKTGPQLFPDLEHIEGDRYTDLSNLKAAVKEGRTWHSAIDTFAYVPSVVNDMMAVIADAVRHYTVVSTISVYADSDTPNADETAPLAKVTDEVAAGIPTHREVGAHYGAMKARCEAAADKALPGRVFNVRPGLIVGPRDTSGRFTYWPARASEGGTMIGPGEPTDPVQIIDVRDLAEFIVLATERKLTGNYNAISTAGKLTIGNIIDASNKVTNKGTKVEWIDAQFLSQNGVQAWQHMPCWIPPSAPGYAGIGRINCSKAAAAGLTIRPLHDTVAATLAYYTTRGAEIVADRGAEFGADWRKQIRGGLPAEREAEVLEAWKNR